MGYYTRFELTVISGSDGITDYKKEIETIVDYDYLFSDEVKWYDHEKDMKKYSESHPKVLFLLEGEGEEPGDIWKAYFQNGKMFKTKAELRFESFSIDKLS
jgi:hypothetical protein